MLGLKSVFAAILLCFLALILCCFFIAIYKMFGEKKRKKKEARRKSMMGELQKELDDLEKAASVCGLPSLQRDSQQDLADRKRPAIKGTRTSEISLLPLREGEEAEGGAGL